MIVTDLGKIYKGMLKPTGDRFKRNRTITISKCLLIRYILLTKKETVTLGETWPATLP